MDQNSDTTDNACPSLKPVDIPALVNLGMEVATDRLLSDECGPQDVNAFFNALARIKSMGGDVEMPETIIEAMNQRIAASRSKRTVREAH